jgi:threonine dehydratase
MAAAAHPRAALVRAAAAALGSAVVRTPLLEAPLLNRLARERLGDPGLRVLVKAEALQHTGAFKFRGALNRLLQPDMDAAARRRGVVAFSSGNFAQALALASARTGTRCTIVSPHDAPPLKLERTRLYGAEVLLSTPAPGQNREVAAAAMAAATAEERGARLLHPFDDWPVVYGQGTLALELFEQARALPEPCEVAALVVPTGGGGMLAGCCLAAELASPDTRLWCVEPEGYADHAASLRAGERRGLEGPPAPSACDALQASAPGVLTWEVSGPRLAGAVACGDAAAAEAMAVAFTELKLVLEPSGALGLAALLAGLVPVPRGGAMAVVACGGNVALETFRGLTSAPAD